MVTREFGTTGVRVPIIGQGTWQMKGKGADALRGGIDLGMTHIDTAEMYVGAEEIVAQAIQGRRKEIFLVSKVLPYCKSKNIRVGGFSPFAQGVFPAAGKQGKALQTIPDRHGRTPRHVALNFLTRRKGLFTIPKASSVEHVQENAGGTGWDLTA